MSKYDMLWTYISNLNGNEITMTFDEIAQAGGVPMDHSFLTYKKELLSCGWQVGKISMKNQTVQFARIGGEKK